MVPSHFDGPGVLPAVFLGENPLPGPFLRGFGIRAVQGCAQMIPGFSSLLTTDKRSGRCPASEEFPFPVAGPPMVNTFCEMESG